MFYQFSGKSSTMKCKVGPEGEKKTTSTKTATKKRPETKRKWRVHARTKKVKSLCIQDTHKKSIKDWELEKWKTQQSRNNMPPLSSYYFDCWKWTGCIVCDEATKKTILKSLIGCQIITTRHAREFSRKMETILLYSSVVNLSDHRMLFSACTFEIKFSYVSLTHTYTAAQILANIMDTNVVNIIYICLCIFLLLLFLFHFVFFELVHQLHHYFAFFI